MAAPMEARVKQYRTPTRLLDYFGAVGRFLQVGKGLRVILIPGTTPPVDYANRPKMAGDDKKSDFPDLDDLIMDVFKPDLFKDMSMSDFGKGVVVGALVSRVSALTLGALAGVAFGIYMEQNYKVPNIRQKVSDLLVKKDDKKD
ncbi:hypothetical protein Bbelb_268000 [Branchiostoma belcheri]|nr:hypothetical protein Bbelb_268000 [Branchiostoma belcheri]